MLEIIGPRTESFRGVFEDDSGAILGNTAAKDVDSRDLLAHIRPIIVADAVSIESHEP
jgi:hypothetical protein